VSKEDDEAQADDAFHQNLRRVYRKKVEEDVPDRLLDLIAQLRADPELTEDPE